jgi:transposase
MAQEHRADYPSLWAAIESIAPQIGCVPQILSGWVKKVEIDSGQRLVTTTSDAQHIKELEREVKGLRRANDILKTASAFFAQAELDRRLKSRRPISTATAMLTGPTRPGCNSTAKAFAWRAARWSGLYGAWGCRAHIGARACAPPSQTHRHRARWTASIGSSTLASPTSCGCRTSLMSISGRAGRAGRAVVFVVDVYALRIVDWRVGKSMQTNFVLDALEQALYERQPAANVLLHHSDSV